MSLDFLFVFNLEADPYALSDSELLWIESFLFEIQGKKMLLSKTPTSDLTIVFK